MSDGSLVLEALPSGQLQVALLAADARRTVVNSVASPTLRVSGGQPVTVTIEWSKGSITRFDLDKHDLLTDETEILIGYKVSHSTGVDFSQRNEQVRRNRYSVVQNMPVNPRRKQGGDAYMYAALRGEVEQIEDLISAVRQGKEAHTAGLASRIRLLVVGKPIGLLQHCAALKKSPLIIYADRNPESLPPIADALAIFGIANAKPTAIYCNPVDLDVWLSFPAIKVGDQIFSHRTAIKDVGDTIGSHRDPGIPQSVQVLQLNRSQMGAVYRDIQRYVLEVADAILSLAHHVLLQAEIREAP